MKMPTAVYEKVMISAGIVWISALGFITRYFSRKMERLLTEKEIGSHFEREAAFLVFDAAAILPLLAIAFIYYRKTRSTAKEIREDSNLYKSLFNSSLNIVYVLNKNGDITNLNPAVSEIIGISALEAIGKNINSVLVHSSEGPRYIFPIEDEHDAVFLERVRHKNGHIVELEVTCVPNKGTSGKVEGYIGVAKDVTQERNYSRQLEILSQRYRSLFEYSPHMACLLDDKGNILDVNAKMEEMLGRDKRGKHFGELLYDPQSGLALELFQKALKGHTVEDYQTLKDHQGLPMYIEYRSIPIMVDNEVVGLCVAAKDLTEKRELELLMERELQLAALIQNSVLCKPLAEEELAISGHYVPANNIGGDMYMWFKLDSSRYAVLILDVMGHGLSAALISMSIRSLMEGMLLREQLPGVVMKELNGHMYRLFNQDNSSTRFFTAIYAIVDTNNRVIDFINAGHPPGIVLDQDGCRLMESSSPPLGFLQDMNFHAERIVYQGQGQMILYTDGIFDYLEAGPGVASSVKEIGENFKSHPDLDCREYIEGLLSREKIPSEQDDISIVKVQLF